jgi:hypothetical protein
MKSIKIVVGADEMPSTLGDAIQHWIHNVPVSPQAMYQSPEYLRNVIENQSKIIKILVNLYNTSGEDKVEEKFEELKKLVEPPYKIKKRHVYMQEEEKDDFLKSSTIGADVIFGIKDKRKKRKNK